MGRWAHGSMSPWAHGPMGPCAHEPMGPLYGDILALFFSCVGVKIPCVAFVFGVLGKLVFWGLGSDFDISQSHSLEPCGSYF